jgi:GTP-binding protein HflX
MMPVPTPREKVFVVCVRSSAESFDEIRQEMSSLVESAGGGISGVGDVYCRVISAKYYIGTGKVEELAGQVAASRCSLVVFSCVLSAIQQRNLENLLKTRVLDRTGLVLDIFACRAKSSVGKIQVELAQTRYMASRLAGAWTHLERQKGGIGLRGPGETQIETDRRLIQKRISQLSTKLELVHRQLKTQKKQRVKSGIFRIALVGYTNAGKSTLFNRLTSSRTYVADQLFATLDTSTRKMFLSDDIGGVVLSDTVGFIRDLPHGLVEAFRATLEESLDADLLLHVVDSSSPYRDMQIEEVNKVVKEIGADQVPQIEVWNKCDLFCSEEISEEIEQGDFSVESIDSPDGYDNIVPRVLVSATSGFGLDRLRDVLITFALAKKRGVFVDQPK